MNPDQWHPVDTDSSYVDELRDELPGNWEIGVYRKRLSDERAAFKLVARHTAPGGRQVEVEAQATRDYLALKPFSRSNTVLDALWAELTYRLRNELRAAQILGR